MKVKDLIKKLEKFDSELDVYVYADHGQSAEPACSVEEDKYNYEGNPPAPG